MRAISKDEPRALFFINGLANFLPRAKTGFRQRRIPAKSFIFGDQDVGVAIAGEINELQIGVVPSNVREETKRAVCLPLLPGVRS